ncbi:MAG: amidohydrolase [Angelakisella sp.]
MTITLTQPQRYAVAAAQDYKPLMRQLGNTLWEYAEIGLQEYRSAAYLMGQLREHGFVIHGGQAGFPTGFTAEFCNGAGPTVALLCEYDALPALSTTQPGGNGHGCGHNLFGAASVTTALLLRQTMLQFGIGGRLRLYGCPGEENFASKAYYVHHGLFDDVDCSVGFHAHDQNRAHFDVEAATLLKDYTFHGKPAHAGNYPWLGNSALDAVEIMNVAANYLREHVRPDVRIQYVITKGGDAYNIVPELAASRYAVRSASVSYMEEVSCRVDNCAHAAALATGCTVEIQFLDKTYNTVLLREYAELAQGYLEQLGAPQFSPDELETAKQFGDGSGLCTDITPLPACEGYQGGASDEGDVSWVVPHQSIYVANLAKDTALHTLSAVGQTNLPAAYTAMVTQVGATAAMVLELLQTPSTLAQLKAAHAAKLGAERYPKNPGYTLPPAVNPNCAGVSVAGNAITADFSQLLLLPPDYAGAVLFQKDGETVARLEHSGTVTSLQPLEVGDSLFLFAMDGDWQQLLGYYTL